MKLQTRPRVLFVIGSMGGGGAERQMLEIIKRLDRNRFDAYLYLAVKDGELLSEVPADVPIFAYWDGAKETQFRTNPPLDEADAFVAPIAPGAGAAPEENQCDL